MNSKKKNSKLINLFYILLAIISIVVLVIDRFVRQIDGLGFALFTLLMIVIAITNRHSKFKFFIAFSFWLVVTILKVIEKI
jgi:hypothetical protein